LQLTQQYQVENLRYKLKHSFQRCEHSEEVVS